MLQRRIVSGLIRRRGWWVSVPDHPFYADRETACKALEHWLDGDWKHIIKFRGGTGCADSVDLYHGSNMDEVGRVVGMYVERVNPQGGEEP